MTPSRPALRWHGGKWLLAPWVIEHFPAHRTYVEPFGGAASVLLRKERAYAEVYNDLDGEVVSFFRVLRDPAARSTLIDRLRLTPFARAEFEESYQVSDDPIEEARRLAVRSFMGFGNSATNRDDWSGFRCDSRRSGGTPSRDWANLPDSLLAVAERLAGVIIEQRQALSVMQQHDGPNTLHYVDPPYLPETRATTTRAGKRLKHAYRHELTVDDHHRLLEALRGLDGMVVLSGYPSDLYDAALTGWERIERPALADGARERTEVLWLNRALMRRRGVPQQAAFTLAGAAPGARTQQEIAG